MKQCWIQYGTNEKKISPKNIKINKFSTTFVTVNAAEWRDNHCGSRSNSGSETLLLSPLSPGTHRERIQRRHWWTDGPWAGPYWEWDRRPNGPATAEAVRPSLADWWRPSFQSSHGCVAAFWGNGSLPFENRNRIFCHDNCCAEITSSTSLWVGPLAAQTAKEITVLSTSSTRERRRHSNKNNNSVSDKNRRKIEKQHAD